MKNVRQCKIYLKLLKLHFRHAGVKKHASDDGHMIAYDLTSLG